MRTYITFLSETYIPTVTTPGTARSHSGKVVPSTVVTGVPTYTCLSYQERRCRQIYHGYWVFSLQDKINVKIPASRLRILFLTYFFFLEKVTIV
jgi:hypothetical protein